MMVIKKILLALILICCVMCCNTTKLVANASGSTDMVVDTPSIVVKNNTKGISISWERTYGAKGYKLYRKCSGDEKFIKIESFDGNVPPKYYIDTNIKSGKKYYYKLKAYNKRGKYKKVTTSKAKSSFYLATPAMSGRALKTGGIKLSWKKVTGAENYRVYYKNNGTWQLLTKTKNTTYTDEIVKTDASVYTVKAVKGDYASAYKSYVFCKKHDFQKEKTIKEKVWVVDKEAYDVEDIVRFDVCYECEVCGEKVVRRTEREAQEAFERHIVNNKKCNKAKPIEYRTPIGGIVHYEEEGHYEELPKTTYHCKDCGILDKSEEYFNVVPFTDYVKITISNPNWENFEKYIFKKVSGGKWKKIASLTESSYVDKNVEDGKKYYYFVGISSVKPEKVRSRSIKVNN